MLIDSLRIECIIPQYLDDIGDGTIIYTGCNKLLIKRSIKTVMKNFCKDNGLDYKISKDFYGELIDAKKNVPVVISEQNVFIPVKVRKPIAKNDGAYGYVNYKNICCIKECKSCKQILLILSCGQAISVLSSKTAFYSSLHNGRQILSLLTENTDLLNLSILDKGEIIDTYN